MNGPDELHELAMAAAERAVMATRLGDPATASSFFRTAYDLERRAALAIANQLDLEPSRSVLLRSAAALALRCGEIRESERLISIALTGNPPTEILDQLRDLLEEVHFERHLDAKGLALDPNEFEMSLAGKGVGYGIAPSIAVVERIVQTEKLLVRFAERRAGRPFRERGSAPRALRETVELFLSVPRAASYAVTFRVGKPKEQLAMPEVLGTPEVIGDLLECMRLFEAGEIDAIAGIIDDPAYFNNFVGLAQRIAPDGDEIGLVGFTAEHAGERRTIALTPSARRAAAETPLKGEEPSAEIVTVSGRLLFADERSGRHSTIRLVSSDDREHRIEVPPGMMSDIVKPLWNESVIVRGVKYGKYIRLKHIERADD